MAITYKTQVHENEWQVWHSNVNGDELLRTFKTEEEAEHFLNTGKILITPEMVEAWQGSDNLRVDDFIDLLADIANGDYPVELFREDVLDFHDNKEE